MQDLSIRGILNHPAADSFTRAADGFENQVRLAGGKQGPRDAARLRAAASEFESLFVSYLLKVMRETIEESGLFEGSLGKDVYSELFDQEVARLMAQRGSLGISTLVIRQLEKQEPGSGGPQSLPAPQAAPEPEAVPGETGAAGNVIPELLLPVRAPVSSRYGLRTDPFTHGLRFHKGVDMAAPEGTCVPAALRGKVVRAGYEGDYGKTVVIDHGNGYQTRYAHLASIEVRAGDEIQTRQILGKVGSTGRSTGPHLHFEVTQNGTSVDPTCALAE